MFHVTRQTVSNWENGKSYPELQILVSISDQFDVEWYVLDGIKNQGVTKRYFNILKNMIK